MPILADHADDRAQQLLALTERLTALVNAEHAAVEARREPDPTIAEERNRLANVYRQEMMQLSQDRLRLAGAQPALRAKLERATTIFMQALDRHALAIAALKEVSEGLVQAMATEIARQTAGPQTYDGGGYRARSSAPVPVAVNRSA